MRSAALAISACLFSAGAVHAQTAAPSGKTLAATMNVYAFPQAGQAADKQSKDESDCYAWATSNTGSDPFALSKQQAQQQQQTQQQVQQAKAGQQGAGARGAAGGAMAGAVIGEIANDDAGQGAAWGAAVGAVKLAAARKGAQRGGGVPGPAKRGRAAAGNCSADRQLQESVQRLPRGQTVPRQVLARLAPADGIAGRLVAIPPSRSCKRRTR